MAISWSRRCSVRSSSETFSLRLESVAPPRSEWAALPLASLAQLLEDLPASSIRLKMVWANCIRESVTVPTSRTDRSSRSATYSSTLRSRSDICSSFRPDPSPPSPPSSSPFSPLRYLTSSRKRPTSLRRRRMMTAGSSSSLISALFLTRATL